MHTPSAPTPPDPTATAAAQTSINTATAEKQAQLSRFNQVTPYGNLNWTNDGNDNWTATTNLDPRVQGLVDSMLGNQQKLESATGNAVDNVNSTFSKPIDYGALPQGGDIRALLENSPFNQAGLDAQGLSASAGQIANKAFSQWDPQKLSYDNVAPVQGADNATRQRVQDALYGQYTRELDPQYGQQESKLRSDLMNRGIVEGSDAWNTQLDNFNRSKNDAYNQANTSAIAGTTAQMRDQFDQSLAGHQQGVADDYALWQAPQTQAANAMGLVGNANNNLGAVNMNQLNYAKGIQGAEDTQRQNALTEQQQQRTSALQWLATLQGGSAPPMPQFSGQQGPTIQPANYMGAVQNNYQGQLQNYQSQMGSRNSLLGMLGSLGAGSMSGGSDSLFASLLGL